MQAAKAEGMQAAKAEGMQAAKAERPQGTKAEGMQATKVENPQATKHESGAAAKQQQETSKRPATLVHPGMTPVKRHRGEGQVGSLPPVEAEQTKAGEAHRCELYSSVKLKYQGRALAEFASRRGLAKNSLVRVAQRVINCLRKQPHSSIGLPQSQVTPSLCFTDELRALEELRVIVRLPTHTGWRVCLPKIAASFCVRDAATIARVAQVVFRPKKRRRPPKRPAPVGSGSKAHVDGEAEFVCPDGVDLKLVCPAGDAGPAEPEGDTGLAEREGDAGPAACALATQASQETPALGSQASQETPALGSPSKQGEESNAVPPRTPRSAPTSLEGWSRGPPLPGALDVPCFRPWAPPPGEEWMAVVDGAAEELLDLVGRVQPVCDSSHWMCGAPIETPHRLPWTWIPAAVWVIPDGTVDHALLRTVLIRIIVVLQGSASLSVAEMAEKLGFVSAVEAEILLQILEHIGLISSRICRVPVVVPVFAREPPAASLRVYSAMPLASQIRAKRRRVEEELDEDAVWGDE